ncbi:MAG: PilZ domain-containing protein [bacterium]
MGDRRKKEDRRDDIQFKLPKDDRDKSNRRQMERRTKERIPVKMWIRNIDGDANYFQQTGNLSVSGMYILSPNPYPENTTIEVEFQVPGTEHIIRCRALVLKCNPDGQFMGISVKFVDMSEKDRQVICRAIDDLIGEYWYIME